MAKKSTKIKEVPPVVAEETINVDPSELRPAEPEVEEVSPVEEPQLSPEEVFANTVAFIQNIVVSNYVDNFSDVIEKNKVNLVNAYLEQLPEDTDELKKQLVEEAKINTKIRVSTYNSIELNISEEAGLESKNAIMYYTLKTVHDALKGYEDTSINVEIVPVYNYDGQVFIVFRDEYLSSLSAGEKVLDSLSNESMRAIAAVCLIPTHFPQVLVDIVTAHVSAWMPSLSNPDNNIPADTMQNFVNTVGADIINTAIRCLSITGAFMIQDPEGLIMRVVGRDAFDSFPIKIVINTSGPQCASIVAVHYVAPVETDEVAEAVKGL